jgi:hypothetical protein
MPTRENDPPKSYLARWLVNCLVALNQCCQCIGSPLWNFIDLRTVKGPYGDPDDTFCSVVGRDFRAKYNGKVPWRHPFAAFIQHLTEFWYRDKHHTAEAVEDDEGRDAPGRG